MTKLAAFFAALFALTAAAHAENAILVFDASGSMWGQIDGKTKIEIAREVMGGLLSDIPADRSLGLVAYGHRREGDCADIEEIVPVGTDRAAIGNAVNHITPKGKTPLTDGVRFAAEKLRYTEEKATVILVSDGAESCKADPCALGAALEAAGVDLTVHVVGFGLESETESAGLKCLAAATGGRYFEARNASELGTALAETVAAPPAPVEAGKTHLFLRATELEGGPEVTSGLSWRVAPADGEAIFSAANAGSVETDVTPGTYVVSVTRASDGLKGEAPLEAQDGGSRTVTIPLVFPLEATLTLAAPTGAAGSEVSVAWTGPNRKGDYITVVKKTDEVTAYRDYAYTEEGTPVKIELPTEPGDYEMRYVLGAPQRVLATAAIAATAVTASLAAPDTATAGGAIEVTWQGPGYADDWVTIVKPDAGPSDYKSYFNTKDGATGRLTMPTEPGAYELRYVTNNNTVLARRPITVTATEASFALPAEAVAGVTIEVGFTGPRNDGDWVTVVKPDAGPTEYNSYFDTDAAGPYRLEMPLEPGDYEVRYVLKGTSVLARAPIKVTPVTASFTASPASVAAGASFKIAWTGPNYGGDWLTIVKPGDGPTAYGSYVDANNGTPASLTAPAAAGDYELRYVLKGKQVIARQAITVTGN